MNTSETKNILEKEFEFVKTISNYLSGNELWDCGFLLVESDEIEEEISKVPCLLSLQTDSRINPQEFPLSLPKSLKKHEKNSKGNLSASLFLEVLQDEVLSRLKAMDRGGTNR